MNASFNLEFVKEFFPKDRTRHNLSIAKVPMDFFTKNEKCFRELMKKHNLQLFFRGSRVSNKSKKPSNTMRCDANAVVLYRK